MGISHSFPAPVAARGAVDDARVPDGDVAGAEGRDLDRARRRVEAVVPRRQAREVAARRLAAPLAVLAVVAVRSGHDDERAAVLVGGRELHEALEADAVRRLGEILVDVVPLAVRRDL